MENSTVSGLRSRSRSKTPFLRSSCDRETCVDNGDHSHKSGRKTPVKRSTPVKQLRRSSTTRKSTTEPIEEEDEYISPPAHRTRQAAKTTAVEKIIKTSDYSSEESPDRNRVVYNHEYERVTTSSTHRMTGSSFNASVSPIHAENVSERSARFGSPAYSACSSDSSFAEQTLADATILLDTDPKHSLEHLPYRLYKMAGEYWNKYPKTDYTYSPMSKDRVELAPGQVAVPNMSRRSLSQFRVQGPLTSPDDVDLLAKSTWSSTVLRKRYQNIESSDDESSYTHNGGYTPIKERWWITKLLITIYTTITTSISSVYRKVVGPSHRYPYTSRSSEKGLLSRAGTTMAAPFVWIYTLIKKVVTTTVTTITETVTPSTNHVSHQTYLTSNNYQKHTNESRSRKWPLLLLLLLPILGYGCYRCDDIVQMLPQFSHKNEEYKPLDVVQDPNLLKRIAALEVWALSVDSKLKVFDDKLSVIDNIDSKIESISLRHLQQNLIQIFNLNSENGEAIAGKLRDYFDKHYVTKDQMENMSEKLHQKISDSKPEFDEQRVRELVQEYLVIFERRQKEVLLERVREYIKEVQVQKIETGFDVETVKRIVTEMLKVYDADKTGIVDYALESAGGQVISTKCTELYQIRTKKYFMFGFPVWSEATSPRYALTPGAMPAECWAFQGFPGYLVVRLYAIIEVTGFSMEHMSRLLAVDGKIESAPKNFSVYGLIDELDQDPHLFGDYTYDANGTSIQYFPVKHPKIQRIGDIDYPVAYDIIELRIESNHGNPTYTCVYRFRVHGNPLSDIRKATEDSLSDGQS